ncbi:hypothetical protein [Marinobacter changyiensis]|uniref:hypothetical protein n=1 Tax=Marinobacter changyiensis TaxID=2604091 RepID=UPI0012656085|nr:hypothetical protein [Marinobacter changyiensis]
MVMFGAFYYMLPLLTKREWPWPRLLVVGFAVYFFAMSIGGWLQGLGLLEVGHPFADITRSLQRSDAEAAPTGAINRPASVEEV